MSIGQKPTYSSTQLVADALRIQLLYHITKPDLASAQNVAEKERKAQLESLFAQTQHQQQKAHRNSSKAAQPHQARPGSGRRR